MPACSSGANVIRCQHDGVSLPEMTMRWLLRSARDNDGKASGHLCGVGCVRSGLSQENLPLYLGFFAFVHNVRKRGKALLARS